MTDPLLTSGLVEEQPLAVLYTILPHDHLLASLATASPPPRELRLGGRHFLVGTDADGNLRVHRLLSTDPADYLDPRWQPGTLWPPVDL